MDPRSNETFCYCDFILINDKIEGKNTSLSEQFQNPIEMNTECK